MIEYKKYFEARESVSLERKCIPALYMNMESGYADGLKVERKKIREKYTRNTKFKGWFFVLAVLAAAIVTFGILALIIRVTTGSFGYIWIAAIASLVFGAAIGAPVSMVEIKRQREKIDEQAGVYKLAKDGYDRNVYLFNLLETRKVTFMNIIMGGGQLLICYKDENEKLRVDFFKYEEWTEDPDIEPPFLIMEDSKLFGRGITDIPPATFMTTPYEDKK